MIVLYEEWSTAIAATTANRRANATTADTTKAILSIS
jgi:hypothetical protein